MSALEILERIEQTLDSLRPYIASHRGQVEVIDFDDQDGTLLLRLGGTCHGCAASTITQRTDEPGPRRLPCRHEAAGHRGERGNHR